ncbi:MAG: DUF177 domain-containing protein [Verrucomicrobia bacterium]|nr:MAG: DUF177 domain-containing protein [Verrucomicrobiota bacterium]
MKVHLRQIPQGEIIHLEGEEEPSHLELDSAGVEPIGPLRYSLDVGLSGGGLFATGRLVQRVRMICVSCLESFEREMISDTFATQMELGGSESVDLTPEVREDIHLLLPAHPRCDSGGDKTCPAQFPAGSDHSLLSVEKAAPRAIWAALDQLKTPPSDGSP